VGTHLSGVEQQVAGRTGDTSVVRNHDRRNSEGLGRKDHRRARVVEVRDVGPDPVEHLRCSLQRPMSKATVPFQGSQFTPGETVRDLTLANVIANRPTVPEHLGVFLVRRADYCFEATAFELVCEAPSVGLAAAC